MRKIFLSVMSIAFLCAASAAAFAIHEEIPAETQPTEQPSVLLPARIQASQDDYAWQALINLLEKKGIITRNELQDEMRRIKALRLKTR